MKQQNLTIKTSQIKRRVTWGFNPVTRTKPSNKLYTRKNYKVNY